MKTRSLNILVLVGLFIFSGVYYAKGQQGETNAKEIIQKAYDKLQGKSSIGIMSMTIVRPDWSRTVTMKSWSLGNDYSLVYITSPAKEKGQVFLKRKTEMWNWVPSIERMIKLPPSMMMQSWMGSDFTNDDLVKQSSIVDDYEHKIIGSEQIEEYDCYKIELIPDPDAPVVWGKIISWVSKEDFITLRNEYYDEDEYLTNIEILSNIKMMHDRIIPTRFEMIPVDDEGNKTILEFIEFKFNQPIDENFFSIQNMKRVR